MKVQVHLIPQGESEYQYSSAAEPQLGKIQKQLENENFQFTQPLQLNTRLTRVDDNFYLRGDLKFSLNQACSRCAEIFETHFSPDFEAALTLSEGATREELTEESEEVDVVYFRGPTLSFEDFVEEQFRLALPLKPLCKEDCQGLCQSCGINKNSQSCQCIPNLGFNPFFQLKDKA